MQTVTFEVSNQWFDGHAANWAKVFNEYVPKKPRVLEIGSYEGRSAIWILQRLYEKHNGGELYCIDPYIPSDDVLLRRDMGVIKGRFEANMQKALRLWPADHFAHIEKTSVMALSEMIPTMAGTFDVAYIDGNHTSAAALGDLVMCHHLVKNGGVIIVDDYLWDYSRNPLLTPKLGVDGYSNAFADEVRIIPHVSSYQMFFQKSVPEKPAQPSVA